MSIAVFVYVANQALGTHAYEASQDNPGAALIAGGGAGAPGLDEEGLSADHQLLCQIGNCLQLDAVSVQVVIPMDR